MHLTFVFVFLFVFVNLSTCIQEDRSVLAFEPASISLTIGESKRVGVRLLVPEMIPPDINVQFLYDGNTNDGQRYIDTLPNITFTKQEVDGETIVITVIGRHAGHLVVTAQSAEVNISANHDFLLIDIARSYGLNIVIQIVGWIYFAAWSISFYPQIILNFRRKSVVGLNFDFLALNLLGHSCYAIFNLCMYTSYDIQQQYYARHPHGVLPVLLNDVLFSCHAVFACLVTVGQCVFFERGKQRISYVARLIGCVLVVFLLIISIVSLSHHLTTLSLLYYYSYVKLGITIIKYCPQAWMNYKRKSTEGWSIGNILLDFTGGVLSVVQMFLLASNFGDWSSIFGSPTKFGLGFFSILFDVLFIVQHYVLYRKSTSQQPSVIVTNGEANERTPFVA